MPRLGLMLKLRHRLKLGLRPKLRPKPRPKLRPMSIIFETFRDDGNIYKTLVSVRLCVQAIFYGELQIVTNLYYDVEGGERSKMRDRSWVHRLQLIFYRKYPLFLKAPFILPSRHDSAFLCRATRHELVFIVCRAIDFRTRTNL